LDLNDEARAELEAIIDRLSGASRDHIRTLEEGRVTGALRFTLGMDIRNRIRHGEIPALFRWSSAQLPEKIHFDDLSGPILKEIWRVLRKGT